METTSPHPLIRQHSLASPLLSGGVADPPKVDRWNRWMGSQRLGTIGEELACHFLNSKGYKILMKNYECPLGEIDLIAKESGALIFVEVKTRSSLEMGLPVESITPQKRRQIVKTAQYYIQRYGIKNVPCRFDVVSILLLNSDQEPVMELIPDAFGENY